jgi:hypothetical protein
MKLHFLAAAMPLTKRFTRCQDGTIDKSSYPNVTELTSYEESVTTPDEFFAAVEKHAAAGHCLSKGLLRNQLVNQSRAGQTDSLDPSSWIVFDIDGLDVDPEDFIARILPPEFHNVSYIRQWSASQGIDGKPNLLRFHLFFMMAEPFQPETVKTWFSFLNLTHPVLSVGLELTASAVALRYPLDRTVAQSDKLIYIAPPICENFQDPMAGQRITLIRKPVASASFRFTAVTPAQIDELTREKINELRELLGLRPRVAKEKFYEHIGLVCTNPERATVTAEKRGRGFVYLNLNGGDSYGYWYPEQNPKYLHNFKGEPIYVLADILPEYYARLRDEAVVPGRADPVGTPRPFAFRHQPTDTFWNGIYDERADSLIQIAATSGGKKINDFFIQYGFAPPQHIQDWTFEFQPFNDTIVDFENLFCNRFERSPFMRLERSGGQTSFPPIIGRIIRSILGDDAACIDHFTNWLAWIFQTRGKTGTAWVMHGIEGTGKGIFYSKVLVPLFGERYCVLKQLRDLDDKFNAELEQNLIFVLDEAKMSSQSNVTRTVAQLKSLITETFMSVRAMRAHAAQIKNYSNILFFSKEHDALDISETDRRFNVAPRQEQKIQISPAEVEAINAELPQFAQFLLSYQADEARAKTAIDNLAKKQMRSASQDAFEQLVQAVADGDLEYYMLFMNAELPVNQDIQTFSGYKQVMRTWAASVNKKTFISADQLDAAFAYLMPNDRATPQNLQRRFSRKGMLLTIHGVARGVWATWKATDFQTHSWEALFRSPLLPTGAAPGIYAVQ